MNPILITILDGVTIFTLGVVILNLLFIITLLGRESLALPPFKLTGKFKIDFQHWYIFYPSFFYQVAFWYHYFM